MAIDTGTAIGIIIALSGSVGMMITFWRENFRLSQEIRRLQVAIRDERRKNNG